LISLKCVTIALRFATVRRQFGKDKFKEIAILEYPSIRNRLFPLLATAIIPIFAARKINNLWYENYERVFDPKNKEVKELHGLISVIKPLTSDWTIGIMNECRKLMGGLGYSWYAEIPKLINDIHVMVTWEGDNNVLLQQVGKFILVGVQQVSSTGSVEYPSLQFLAEERIEGEKIDLKDKSQLECTALLHKLMKIRAKKSAFNAAIMLSENMPGIELFRSTWTKLPSTSVNFTCMRSP
jgi:acyl-CoA oxidase